MTDGLRKRKRGAVQSKDLNIFEWSIANFAQAFKNTQDGGKMSSPVFVGKSSGLPNSFWRIEVWPKEKDDDKVEKHLDVYLELVKELNQQNPFIIGKSKIFLLDKSHQEVSFPEDESDEEIEEKFEERFGGMNIIRGDTVATHSQLFDGKNKCLEDDVLRIRVKLWIRNGEINAAAAKKWIKDKLHQNFSQLLASSEFSDLTIEVENLILKAHKGILACRSPVFFAMFKKDMSLSL